MANMKNVGENIGFERIRRITGYLVGTLDKWNDAKKAEESDRVKHVAEITQPQESTTYASPN